MIGTELKLELIHWLTNVSDKKLLNALMSIKESTVEEDWSKQLSPKQRKSIEKGLDDHRNGRTLTSKEFWSRYGR